MADADVIPLGARGRPGRGGSRSRTPSSAARSLANGRNAARKRPEPPAPGEGAPGSEQQSGQQPPRKPSQQPSAQPLTQGRPAEDPAEGAGRTDAAEPSRPAQPAVAPEQTAPGGEDTRAPARTRSRPSTRDAGAGPDARSDAGSVTAPPGSSSPAPPADEVFVRRRGGRIGFDLAAALGNAAHEVFGDNWEHRLAEMLAFLRRRVTGDYVVDEFGFDPDLTSRLAMATVRPLVEKWFRVEVQGIENIPTDGGALLVANHSGTLPLDSLVTGLVVHDHADRYLRMLGADLVFRLPFFGEAARKAGATLACNEDAERMLGQGELVGVWPEGFKGVGKPFSERYTLQRFGRGGFVSAALHTRVPIVPCSIVGAEEIYPLVGNLPTLARLLGVPYIPITPFFPWLGPLGMVPLPSKWLIEFGEPIRTDALTDEQADDPMIVFNLTDQVRETIQQTLYALLMQRRNVFF
jgi:1-acyl-sn-glycerol-3-phosphate acyltransferase